MRASWMVAFGGALLVLALVVARGGRTAPAVSDARDERVSSLEAAVETLRGRVGAAEGMGATALARADAVKAAPAAVAGERESAAVTASQALPPPPTPEHQAKIFATYFRQLDDLRSGGSSDPAIVQRLSDAIAKAPDLDRAHGGPSAKSVDCGNGYCRVSLSFDNPGDAMDARTKLAIALQGIVSGVAIYYDPASHHVEGYFTTGDKTMPPLSDSDG